MLVRLVDAEVGVGGGHQVDQFVQVVCGVLGGREGHARVVHGGQGGVVVAAGGSVDGVDHAGLGALVDGLAAAQAGRDGGHWGGPSFRTER